MWEKGKRIHCWCEWKLGQPLWNMVWRFLKGGKIELPLDLAIPLLVTYPKENKSLYKKMPALSTVALVTIAKSWNHRCPSSEDWIKSGAYGRTQWLKPVIIPLWEDKVGGSQVQEMKTILANMVKPCLYQKYKT